MDHNTLVKELKRCGTSRDLERGKLLHLYAHHSGFHTSTYVSNTLIFMYSKCGDILQARRVFDTLGHRTTVSWNVLILGYVENQQSLTALEAFTNMDRTPDHLTLVAALKACMRLPMDNSLDRETCLRKGASVHGVTKELGYTNALPVASALVEMYCKLGEISQARAVFDGLATRDVVCWNVLILGYVENGEFLQALEMFDRMDCPPNSVTFLAALKACGGLAAESETEKKACLARGVSVHRRAVELGFEKDIAVSNTLVDMYSKCGDMQQARRVFDGMRERNSVSWTALIVGYVGNREFSTALEVYSYSECEAHPFVCAAAVKACAGLATGNKSDKADTLQRGLAIHREARELGFDKDVVVATALVDMYSKFGEMQQARFVFDRMTGRNVVSWNVLILGYVENGQMSVALDVFNGMNCVPDHLTFVAAIKACGGLVTELDKTVCLQKGTEVHKRATELGFDRDLLVSSALVDMYSKCGETAQARVVFEGMKLRDVVAWTALISGYVENGEMSTALDVFSCMNCQPNRVTLASVLKACAYLGAVELGHRVHDQACELGWEQDEMVATGLLNFYGKCGDMEAAQRVFNRMTSRDTVSWNALIGGYTSLGRTSQVFSLVKKMEASEVPLNGVTLQLILTACSHAGLLEEGQKYFDKMWRYGVEPTLSHYGCMVDMLGRANKLKEALALVREMPFSADSVVWMALLGACRKWRNLEVGEIAFNALVALDEDRGCMSAACVLMRNIYKSLGMQREGEEIEAQRKALTAWKKPVETHKCKESLYLYKTSYRNSHSLAA